MKHKLKRKYKWTERDIHFSKLDMVRRWSKYWLKMYTMPSRIFDSAARIGEESALEGGAGTTNPATIKINKPMRFIVSNQGVVGRE
jgi:hypothetical protein